MTDSTPARDFLVPRMQALLREAGQSGIGRDVAVAVLIDVLTGPGFNDVPIDPGEEMAAPRPQASVADAVETPVGAGEPFLHAGMADGGTHRRVGVRGPIGGI